MSQRLLSLDLSSVTGWALLERGTTPRFGTLKLPSAIAGDHGGRFAHLFEWLGDTWSVHRFDGLAFEKPILPRKSGDLATTMDTLTLLWGLTAIVQLYAGQRGMPCQGVGVQAAKIALTGKQHAKKDEMVVAAMKTMAWRVQNDHEADAGAVGLVAYEQIWPKRRAA